MRWLTNFRQFRSEPWNARGLVVVVALTTPVVALLAMFSDNSSFDIYLFFAVLLLAGAALEGILGDY